MGTVIAAKGSYRRRGKDFGNIDSKYTKVE
jgi:hypothetical protein